ncbi:DUF1707 and DUF4190 domain-containing protein [Streptomyces sp. SP17BM10]|uniref:DUF1707 and DUF4190 domain-containing protein n=1 Tax=Streptomyces sp. SP17BM10 TaxID=3002530 RepID=UPI002E78B796|nr:DUF1707 and DUF4190 domain-containing protein [Streptomyces sp. SP17BM10]MEE1787138.1 DUF1707 and DUF4190 domain-containing protein [Streptomyces sp. SP17BM10]
MAVQPWGEPSPQSAMRAAHADRDRTIDVLKAAYAEGRLSLEEYEQRHEAASHAQTYGQLSVLVADLPSGPVAPPAAFDGRPVPQTFQAYVPPPVPYPPYQVRSTNGLAVTSMVLGLSGLSLPAVITGHIARSQIRQRNQDGDWAAVIGLVVGYLGSAFWALMFLGVVLAAGRG